jgi:ABC-type Mn2+/Zn2+ transport system permease subunit
MPDLSDPAILNAFLAAGGMAIACAILSVFVVARRWAFMGEGISHSGFGGAGTAWMLAVAFPDTFNTPLAPYVFVLLFCFAAAVGIGWLSSTGRVTSDAAIGIFLVASLAWGFVGQHIYTSHYHLNPAGFSNLLFGQMQAVTQEYTVLAIAVALLVAGLTYSLSKEIIAYCFDPLLARTSGVRTTFIHYLLMAMMALAIVVGIRVVGSVLVTALLVLPAATANMLTRKLSGVMFISLVIALVGAWGGLLISENFRMLPAGSCIVLTMFAEFLIVMLYAKLRR